MTEGRGPADWSGVAEHARPAPGTPCWVSLRVRDLAATQDFYGALFGWEFRPGPGQLGPYVRAMLHGRDVAGIGILPPGRRFPVAWTPYLATDDVDSTAHSIRYCGGTVGVGPLDADDAGRLAVGLDPEGAAFGIWQASSHRARGVSGEPGTPAWHELLTTRTSHVTRFYESVFGIRAQKPDPGDEAVAPGDERLLTVGGRPVARVRGLGDALPPERGPHWTTYFQVLDVDKASTRVVELGGRLLQGPHSTARGRVASVADPEGAGFCLFAQGSR